jgi:hypothetical protein
MTPVVCSFYIRPVADSGHYSYEPVSIGSPHHDGKMHTPYPPQVGDLVHLWDTIEQRGGMHEVLTRQRLHSSYGSANWPLLEKQPTVGPLLELIVEPAEGLFRDQAPRPDDEEENRK